MSLNRLPIGLLLIGMLVTGCLAPAPAGPGPDSIPTAAATPAQVYHLIFPSGSTATPFQPVPVTGTPPPTSTPIPTPLPSPTPSPTPWLQPTFAPPSEPVSGIPAPFPLLSPEHHINFVLLGSDSRGGASFRTDVVMIVMVDPDSKSVSLLSLPRDLYVYIPGWTMNRINTAYLHGDLVDYPGGGMALIKDTILYNLGIRIDHVALVDFDGFRRIVDQVGGIDVPMVCPFTEWTVIDPSVSIQLESNWELITVGPGKVHMDGDMALWYARARMRSSDFDRGRRQQELIRALFSAATAQNLILHAPELYDDFRDTVTTDVGLQTILSLVQFGLDLDEAQIRSFYIGDAHTWGWMTPGGASVLLPDREAVYAVMLEAVAPPAEIEEEDPTLVEVWNWASLPDLDVLAAERLHYAGFETSLLPAEDRDANKTVLYVLTADPDPEISQALLDLFALADDRLVDNPQQGTDTDYRLVLGNDFDPCFNPAVP